MKKTIVLLIVISTSVVFSQTERRVKCLSNLFDKERIELSHHQKLAKSIDREFIENVVGDTLEFWVFKHPWAKIKAVCKAVGENSYIFVETGMWDAGFVDSIDIANVHKSFEEQTLRDSTKGIYETIIENFGPAPNSLDGDPKIYILFYDMGGYGNGSFFAFNQYTQATIDSLYGAGLYYSNEKEILNLNARNDISSNLMLSVVAHEFQHMIHWNWDADEESWINEGCGEYAMYLYGFPDPIIIFNMYPDNDLTMWDSGFSDYVQSYLFIMYLFEQYGGANAIKALVEEKRNGTEGVTQALSTLGYSDTMNEVFSNWAIANYLDDTTQNNGKYGYFNIELPEFETFRSHSNYPIEQVNGSVSPWAADYIWMNNGTPQNFIFDGNDSGIFHVSVIKIDTAHNPIIEELEIDAQQNAIYNMQDFDERWNQIIFVISNQQSSGVGNYNYSTQTITNINDKLKLPKSFSLSQNYPNPFNPTTEIAYSLPNASYVTLKIYNMMGEEVATLVNGNKEAGEFNVTFNAANYSSGVYLITIRVDELNSNENFSQVKKALLLK
ncbi:MAG: T9SS type A sorting domain-containing protein [Melioribacteraceae bacterium]|nr:T9SS type A sorting domain-containing protein [Melioribacteraceae bacterium]